jgi:hypothetical protein
MARLPKGSTLVGSAVTLAAASSMLLSGCGGPAKAAVPAGPTLAPMLQGDPNQVVAAAAGRTATGGNAGIRLSIPMMQDTTLTSVPGDGTIDFSGDRLQLTSPNEERQFGQKVYVQLPDQVAAQSGKKWVQVDLAHPSPTSQDPLSLYAYDPQQLVTAATAADGMTVVGSETQRGVATQHFTGRLDPARAAQSGLDATFAKELTSLTKGRPVAMDVWLDDAGMIRKLSVALPPVRGNVPAGAHPEVSIELFDFGTADVSFTEPSATELLDTAALQALPGTGD